MKLHITRYKGLVILRELKMKVFHLFRAYGWWLPLSFSILSILIWNMSFDFIIRPARLTSPPSNSQIFCQKFRISQRKHILLQTWLRKWITRFWKPICKQSKLYTASKTIFSWKKWRFSNEELLFGNLCDFETLLLPPPALFEIT